MKKAFFAMLLLLLVSLGFAEKITITDENYSVKLLSSDNMETRIEYNIGSFERIPVQINGETYYQVFLPKESSIYEKGNPRLPKITRSIIIPDDAKMDVKIIKSEYVEYRMKIAPAKGLLTRDIDPETVPFEFSEIYNKNEFYPTTLSELGTPYIMRDFRGITVTVYPFTYNPQTQILRVYTHLLISVDNIGIGEVNVKNRRNAGYNAYFGDLYSNHFLNFDNLRYESVDEHGRIIVICYGQFMDAMQPYVDWKNQKGIETDIYNVAEIGSSANAIKSFIQNEYDQNDGLTFVQLVGDAAQIPTFTSGGGGADPMYSLLEGNDNYPEIFVGRFSAQTVSEVETQVERTVYYERDIIQGEWLHKGTGIASSQGAGSGDNGEADWQHQDVIRDELLSYTYTQVDQIYDTNGGSAADVANALNEGRGIVNYTGHGSNTSWGTTGFSNTNVNNLVNDYKLPFINSVACVNGNFTTTTCFAEAWLRATNNSTGAPTGAIATYMSSINQSWAPPMRGQDEAINLLTGTGPYEGQGNQKNTIGGLWYNGSCNMMDVYGTDGEAMFNTWHIFGDASLQVRTDVPETMQISHISNIMMGMATFDVSTDTQNALVCLSYENQIIASDYTDATGNVTLVLNDLPTEPVDLTLTVTAYNKVTSVETVPLVPAGGAYLVVHESVVNSGGDEIIEFGENAVLTVSIENVGSENASNVEITATTDDDYITLVDDSEYLGDISADEIIDLTDAFSFDVANNIPNEHSFSLILTMSENGRETWESVINMVAYAPIINFDNVLVANDENGILDAGETADLVVNLLNEGGASAENIQVTLNSNDEYITVNSGSSELGLLQANGSGTVNFTVTASEETPIGHVADFDLIITADNDYSTVANFSLTIGLCLEDFESGDFSNYPWEFLGMANWFISSAAYEGDFCAQSGDIDNSESSSISVELDVLTDGEISFWKKVSSENNYDYLRFFIDDTEQDSWSGNVVWSQSTYPVSAGHHTFTWIYAKDGSVSSGSDCAWIDYIIFPAIGIPQPPQLSVNVSELNVVMDMNETEEESFTLTNVGGGTLTYSIGVAERDLTGSYVECSAENFVPGETTTWTFNVFNGSEDNEWITDVYITFPSGVTVNSSTDFVGGSGGDLVSDGTTGDGVTIHWIDANEGWGNIYPDETATAEVNVSISAGFAGNPMHHTGPLLVREGYIVLCPDALGFEGRRHESLDGPSYERHMAMHYIAAGKSLAWKNILDNRRALDSLCSRSVVDASRIGCYGHSLGSTFTWLTGPWDNRLKCMVGNCCMPSQAAMDGTAINHSFSNYIPGLNRIGDIPEYVALTAPRRLHLNFGAEDALNPVEYLEKELPRIAILYKDAGAEDAFSWYIDSDAGHELSESMKDYMLRVFRENL